MPRPRYLVGVNTRLLGKFLQMPAEGSNCLIARDIMASHCFVERFIAGRGYWSERQMVDWKDIQASILLSLLAFI